MNVFLERLRLAFRKLWLAGLYRLRNIPTLQTRKIVPSETPKSEPILKLLNVVFNAAYYLGKYPAAADSDLTPLEHYRSFGWKDNIQPHPLFDGAWYLHQNPEVAASGQEPLQHYLEHGWKQGHSPHRFFDPGYYLQTHPHVATRGQEPLCHYLHRGWKKNLRTCPHGRYHWQEEIPKLDALISPEEAYAILGPQFFSALEKKCPNKSVILLVSDDSTRSDASIVLLDLAKMLREKYFTILLDLCEGEMQFEFQQSCDYYTGFGTKAQSRIYGLALHLQLMLAHCLIEFALVNNLAAAKILPLFSKSDIPSLLFVHEFTESDQPSFALRDAVFRVGRMVFPNQTILDRVQRVCSELIKSQPIILNRDINLPSEFQLYASQIEKWALEQVAFTENRGLQKAEIDKFDVLDLGYFCSPIQPEIWANPSRWYVHTWARNMNRRKPFPGFHPGIYAERNRLLAGDPLVHFLQSGRPSGPWLTRRIDPVSDNACLPVECRVALHIHLFYADMVDEISLRLRRNRTLVDLFISVPDEKSGDLARLKLEACANRMEIAVVPNRGRDIGAFLKMFTSQVVRDYDIVGHLHTKKSLHSKPTMVALWTEFLFENHLGGSEAMMDTILSAMVRDPQIGLVYPDDPNVYGMGKNLPFANDLLARMKLPPVVHHEINFPAGNFFWARTAALQKLLDVHFEWEDFPEEPVDVDGTVLHAIERLLPLIVESAGFHLAITAVPGFTR